MPSGYTPPEDAPPSARNLGALASQQVRTRGHAPFITFYDDARGERTELSYATFDNWVSKTANLLVEELEVGRGDRVATLLGNHWTAVVVAFACWKVGCSVVPVDADPGMLAASGAATVVAREDLVGGLTQDAGGADRPQVVVVGQGMGGRLSGTAASPEDAVAYGEEVLAFADDYDDPDVGPPDEALLVLPAGGSGPPAAVRLTQGNLLAAAEALAAWGLGSDDRLLCTRAVHLPDGLVLAHLGAFAAGASVVLTRTFDPSRLWRRAADERATLLHLAPAHLDQLEAGSPPEGLRCALVPAGADPGVTAGVRERLPVVVGHGLAEATSISTLSPPAPDADTRAWLEEAAGRPVGAVTARAAVAALDAAGAPLDHGAEGRLGIGGPVVMAGYDGRPDLDERALGSGWFASAERGYTDVGPDGATHVFVTGPA
ncbi:MAG: TIGR03089 family protein [Egibacteraceae bacterium]